MLTKGSITNDIYHKLIEYSFSECDTIMLVFRKDGLDDNKINCLNNTIAKLKQKFGKYVLKTRNGGHWVFTKVGNRECGFAKEDPPGFDDLFEIIFLKTTPELKEYILENHDLYAWLNPKYPEDISFFKDRYCWLYSIAHEELCFIYCKDEEEYEYLKSIGIEFVEDKFVPTPYEELYYEDYNNKS